MHDPHRLCAFTLIELLIVVTIIAILAAIALPNFLEAQTRSKVSRVKADMRSLTTALEMYRVDANNYPYRRNPNGTQTFNPAAAQVTLRAEQMKVLTTPIAYITYLPQDTFERQIVTPNNLLDYYDPFQTSWLYNAPHAFRPSRRVPQGGMGYLIFSVGPDGLVGSVDNSCDCPLGSLANRGTIYLVYDPTNGSISTGNIYHTSQFGMENGSALTRQFLP